MPDPPSFHMSAESFRRHGQALIDWIVEYQSRVEHLPVLAEVEPGEIADRLPPSPPEHGEPFTSVLRDVDEIILPGVTHWQSPNFFAFFPANTSGPSILGELLSAGLGVQGMIWATSPACTELETRVLDWMAQMLDLPPRFLSTGRGGGVIQDTASSATLCALLAARERSTSFTGNERGIDRPLAVYVSSEGHSLVDKAVRIAGIGAANLRRIDVDRRCGMRPEALERAIESDRQAGITPCMVCATVGSTSSHGLDPLGPIGAVCRRHDVWLHVDAAMAGIAALCPEFRFIHEGLDAADSYCVNPHKWMFTNFDCDCFYMADREALIRTFSITPEYLRNRASESGEVFDYRDWQIPLGRRFRALKLWFVIRHYGVQGLQHHVRRHVALARQLADRIAGHRHLELAVDPPLNLICFRHTGGDESSEQLLERLNATGRLYMTHTRLHDRYTLRLCVGQTHTEARHVDAAWEAVRTMAEEIASE